MSVVHKERAHKDQLVRVVREVWQELVLELELEQELDHMREQGLVA